MLLDTLSSYIPIEVSYFKDAEHSGFYTIPGVTDAAGNLIQFDKMDELDKNYNVIGKKEWPDDLKVEMLYTDANGVTQRFTLVVWAITMGRCQSTATGLVWMRMNMMTTLVTLLRHLSRFPRVALTLLRFLLTRMVPITLTAAPSRPVWICWRRRETAASMIYMGMNIITTSLTLWQKPLQA